MGALRYILVIVIPVLIGFQESQEYETISWSEDRPLSWVDFKGQPPKSDRVAATTASGITYRYSTSGTAQQMEVDFEIDAHFYPNKSWYKPKLCDTIVLRHEQLHFDITELYTRKFRKLLEEETLTHDNIKAKVRAIYRKVNKELSDFQHLYDAETNFSRNREQQLLWNEKIASLLRE